MSSCVTTSPPSGILLRATLIRRPSASSWMRESISPRCSTQLFTKLSASATVYWLLSRRAWKISLARGAGPHLLGRQAVHFRVAPVADDQPQIGIEHGEALRHVVEGRVELQVLRSELLLLRAEQLVLALQLAVELLAFGDVADADDPAAFRARIEGHRQDEVGLRPADHLLARLAGHQRPGRLQNLVDRLSAVESLGNAALDDLAQRHAGLDRSRFRRVDLRVALIGDDETLVGIEHGDAMLRGRERGVEVGVARFELALALLQQLVLLLELRCEPLALGDVLVDGDHPARCHRRAGSPG